MAGFAKRERQRIIDAYLNEVGENIFVPGRFIDWLSDKPDHEVYDVFFGVDDERAARQYRCDLVRRWVSGLRINVTISSTTHHIGRVDVGEYNTPSMLSPMKGRRHGGGYEHVSDDPVVIAEYKQQAAATLESWLERYGSAVEMCGGSVASIKEIVGLLLAVDVDEAAAA